jgi:hypothetical protein
MHAIFKKTAAAQGEHAGIVARGGALGRVSVSVSVAMPVPGHVHVAVHMHVHVPVHVPVSDPVEASSVCMSVQRGEEHNGERRETFAPAVLKTRHLLSSRSTVTMQNA